MTGTTKMESVDHWIISQK